MKRLTVAAMALGIVTASCSGHGAGSAIPSMNVAGTPMSYGAQSTRAAAVASAPTGFATTATQAISFTGVTDKGALPSTQTLTVHAVLQLHNVDALKHSIAAGQITSQPAFVSTYAPTPADVTRVTQYLTSQGFTNVHATPNNILIDATGSVATIEKAFSTKLESYSDASGKALYANTQPAYVPQSLAGTVVAVLGLNNAQMQAPKPKARATATPAATPTPTPTADPCTKGVSAGGVCPRFYDPATIQIAYDTLKVPTAANTSVAIMTEGDPSQAISDFRWNESVYKLRQVPLSIIQIGTKSSDTSGNGEWVLDMTAIQGTAADLQRIDLYNMPSMSFGDMAVTYNKWASDDKDRVANSSFGGCEVFPYIDGSMLAADEALVEAAAQGQTMFVSTGDNGGFCNNVVDTNGAPGGVPMVEYPASSPYVVAVGGTDLFSHPDGTYLGETAWEAGGGGLSQFEYSPYWESPTQPVGTTPAGLTFRGLPDIAMDASLETGYLVYSSAQASNGGSCTPCITAGTSLASPLAAGAYARIQSAHYNHLGFAAPLFYNVYVKNPSGTTNAGPPPTSLVGGFNDILSGSNGDYTAAPRYDYTTGMGSLDVFKLNAIIGK